MQTEFRPKRLTANEALGYLDTKDRPDRYLPIVSFCSGCRDHTTHTATRDDGFIIWTCKACNTDKAGMTAMPRHSAPKPKSSYKPMLTKEQMREEINAAMARQKISHLNTGS